MRRWQQTARDMEQQVHLLIAERNQVRAMGPLLDAAHPALQLESMLPERSRQLLLGVWAAVRASA